MKHVVQVCEFRWSCSECVARNAALKVAVKTHGADERGARRRRICFVLLEGPSLTGQTNGIWELRKGTASLREMEYDASMNTVDIVRK